MSTELLRADEEGCLVEIVTMSDSAVTFAPQGGGFVRTMERSEFHRRFVTVDAMPRFEAIEVEAEWLPDDLRLPAYSDGMRWNGWAMPYFTKDTGLELVKHMPGLAYDPYQDAFVMARDGSDEDEPEVFSMRHIEVSGVIVPTYPIGAGCWCWFLAERPGESAGGSARDTG